MLQSYDFGTDYSLNGQKGCHAEI